MNLVTSNDGTTIAYDRAGAGPALVVVGGALTTAKVNAPLAALLARRFTVITYDRRGRGRSGDTAPYAIEREIEDLDAVASVADGSAFVYGHSSGAVLSLDAAAADLPIERLAVYEPPFVVDDSRPPMPDDYVDHLRELLVEGRRGDAVEYFMMAGVGMLEDDVASMREAPVWPGLAEQAHALPYDGTIMDGLMTGEPLPSERWAGVTIPTLVMDGGDSPAWAHSAVQALAAVLPDVERRTLEGQTHRVADDALARELEAFFS